MRLPRPDKEGRAPDGRPSRVWNGKDKGHAVRLVTPRDEDLAGDILTLKDYVFTQFEPDPATGKATATRRVSGSRELAFVLFCEWVKGHR